MLDVIGEVARRIAVCAGAALVACLAAWAVVTWVGERLVTVLSGGA